MNDRSDPIIAGSSESMAALRRFELSGAVPKPETALRMASLAAGLEHLAGRYRAAIAAADASTPAQKKKQCQQP